jgi:hypothetical protein
MEYEKSIAEKLTQVISKAAGTVKQAVSQVVESASEAAQHAMEANAEKISRIPPAAPDPRQVAGTTNEQVYIPEASDAVAMPTPLVPRAATPKRQKSGASPPAGKRPVKQAAKAKAAAKKSAALPARKTGKKPATRKTGKTAKKSAVRTSKKAKRKSAR